MSENIHTDLTVADVQLMQQIIEVCANRGAFQPTEFATVGALSSKLGGIISSAQSQPAEEELVDLNLDENAPTTEPPKKSAYVEAEQFELPLDA